MENTTAEAQNNIFIMMVPQELVDSCHFVFVLSVIERNETALAGIGKSRSHYLTAGLRVASAAHFLLPKYGVVRLGSERAKIKIIKA